MFTATLDDQTNLGVSRQQQSSISLDDRLLDINQHPLVQQAGSAHDTEHDQKQAHTTHRLQLDNSADGRTHA